LRQPGAAGATHCLDETLGDFQRHLDPVGGELVAEVAEEAGDCAPSDGRGLRGIRVRHGIRCEQLGKEMHVAFAYGGQEAGGDVLPFLPLGFDRGLCGSHDAPYAKYQALAGLFADADEASCLGATPAEDVMKQERGPLDWQELLEEQEAPERERFRLGCVAGVTVLGGCHGLVGEESASAIGERG
jgi:hypothetical protein